MLISLEGPDRCGKSTLFHALQGSVENAVFVPSLPATKAIMAIMDHVEVYTEALWRWMYDPKKLYIVDRHMAVSASVYAQLYGRPQHDFPYWRDKTYLLYFDVPIRVLQARHHAVGDELFDATKYAKLKQLYEKEVRKYKYARIDGTRPVEELLMHVLPLIESIR